MDAIYHVNRFYLFLKQACINIQYDFDSWSPGKKLRCLRPRQWLGDQIINIYLAFLEEKEVKEPKNFLRCRLFNTFFFKKIFILILMDNHWMLAVINVNDKKFQYLDSLKGSEPKILDALWKQEIVQSLPEQKNGMFMLKYINFYNRDLDLCITQDSEGDSATKS
ncbi:unnamed protein product [Thlaspi arvense]|uniref:Ubiquitin-like protease family profile domain-containing protein n=1 Tax=Thlaspi arvense TaxID=13288 RepID=A0AAU9RMV8_THLAR|nr:unnamed protein product [Thlaspi arvense]